MCFKETFLGCRENQSSKLFDITIWICLQSEQICDVTEQRHDEMVKNQKTQNVLIREIFVIIAGLGGLIVGVGENKFDGNKSRRSLTNIFFIFQLCPRSNGLFV